MNQPWRHLDTPWRQKIGLSWSNFIGIWNFHVEKKPNRMGDLVWPRNWFRLNGWMMIHYEFIVNSSGQIPVSGPSRLSVLRTFFKRLDPSPRLTEDAAARATASAGASVRSPVWARWKGQVFWVQQFKRKVETRPPISFWRKGGNFSWLKRFLNLSPSLLRMHPSSQAFARDLPQPHKPSGNPLAQ